MVTSTLHDDFAFGKRDDLIPSVERVCNTGEIHTAALNSPFRGRRELVCVDHEPWRRSFEKQQADCDSGAGHLLAIIKPKIVRHTIILSAKNLFLLAQPTSPSGRVANPAVINLSIRSSRSLPSTFRAIFLLWRRARSMHSLMILQHDR